MNSPYNKLIPYVRFEDLTYWDYTENRRRFMRGGLMMGSLLGPIFHLGGKRGVWIGFGMI
jgi:hypothetical protein